MKNLGKIILTDVAILKDSEMKMVYGGSGAEKSCTITVNCANGSLSCTDDSGSCRYVTKTVNGNTYNVGISCGGTEHRCTDTTTGAVGL